MTKYIAHVFSERVMVDVFSEKCKSFEQFISKINESHPVIKKHCHNPLMVHAHPEGEYKGVDKVIYFGNYPNKRF